MKRNEARYGNVRIEFVPSVGLSIEVPARQALRYQKLTGLSNGKDSCSVSTICKGGVQNVTDLPRSNDRLLGHLEAPSCASFCFSCFSCISCISCIPVVECQSTSIRGSAASDEQPAPVRCRFHVTPANHRRAFQNALYATLG